MKRKNLFRIVMAVILSLCSLSLTTMQAQESLAAFSEEELFKKGRMEDFKELRPEVTSQEGNVKAAAKAGEEYNYFEREDGTLEITGYSGNDTELIVPAEIDGKCVASIGSRVFRGCRSLIKVELPEGVTSIGQEAFRGCSRLTKVELPEEVTSIGREAFRGCRSLIKVELPEGVTSIGLGAFRGCSSLTSIELPVGLTSVEGYTFFDCSSLSSIKLPASLTKVCQTDWDGMSQPVFRGCTSLKEIIVDGNNADYMSQEGVLYDKEQKELICCPGGKTGSIVIPSSVTSIGPSAFDSCNSLKKIELPRELERISRSYVQEATSAFRDCSSLKEIIVDENNANYMSQEGVLYDKEQKELICCPGGKTGSIVIPSSVTHIDWDAFRGSSLKKIIVDKNNADYASKEGILYDKKQKELICCPGGKTGSIVIPSSVTSISWGAFRDCSGPTKIVIPSSVTHMCDDSYTFNGCSSLKKIIVDKNNTDYMSQEGVLYDKKQKELICCPGGKTGSIVIPSSVTYIYGGAFRGCSSLTKVELSEGVTRISGNVFYGCSSLRSIKLPSSLTYIDVYAFEDCNSDLTLLVYKGSYAETYAKNTGINYRYIDDSKDCSHTWKTDIVKGTTKKNGSIMKTCTKCREQVKETIYAAKSIKLSKTSGIYNGKKQKPSVTVKNSKGKSLKNKDWTVTYPKTMKNVGSYIVTIKLKGNYKGNVKKTFQIVPKGTQISRIKAKKKGFVLKWKKQAVQTTGYEIAYSANKTFAKKTTGTIVIGKNKTISKTVSKLKAGKKYYVKIRTYKTVKLNGKPKKLYSAWSKVKTVTTPK